MTAHTVHRPKLTLRSPVLGVGINDVDEPTNVGLRVRKERKDYSLWLSMLTRCYSDNFHSRCPTYRGCRVVKSWHRFSKFREWLHTQPNWDTPGFVLDKDILKPGNRVYGPAYCRFVPREINCLILTRAAARGDLPQGVRRTRCRTFDAAASSGRGHKLALGSFVTPMEAFAAYKSYREARIRNEAAAEYAAGRIPADVFASLLLWKINPYT